VCSPSYDPTGDNWSNYTQVWDMRFIKTNQITCPITPQNDDLNANWQSVAKAYLNAGGSFFLNGENDAFFGRNTDNIAFLVSIGATANTFDGCNYNTTVSNGYDDFYGTPQNTNNGFAAPQFVGWAVGGIPMGILNGTSYVHDTVSGNWADARDRSIAAGWSGQAQMTGLNPGATGKLFMVWDTTFWENPYYGSYSAVTNNFFTKVYTWLGGTSCTTPTPTFTPTPTPSYTPTPSPSATPTNTPLITSTPTNSPTPTATLTPTITPTPQPTATFTPTPVGLNVWPNPFNYKYAWQLNGKPVIRAYQVPTGSTMSYYTLSGEVVVSNLAETSPGYIDWDATNSKGQMVSSGIYYYVIQNGSTILLKGKILILNGN